MIEASADTAVLVLTVALLAPLLADRLARWITVPSVVLEILLGVLIGPVLLGWAQVTSYTVSTSDIGLAMLMFLAGYEIDFGRVRGAVLRRAAESWLASLILGLGIAVVVVIARSGTAPSDLVSGRLSALVLGLALTTTALGTLLPILSDAGVLPEPLGARVMAVGALGEFGPIVAVALLLTTTDPGKTALLLVAFAAVAAAGIAIAARRRPPRLSVLVAATLGSSTQVAIRMVMAILFGLVWVASRFGLDALLGAFSAGVIIRAFFGGYDREHVEAVESKLQGIGYGYLVPFFFVMSGVQLQIRSLLDNPADAALIPLFLVLFLVVRGLPTWWWFRRDRELDLPRRRALIVFAATELPMVVVITNIGTEQHAIKGSTAAALVTAAALSVVIFPILALRLARQGVPAPARRPRSG